ncbi:Gfo/Idh/MocA family protein [Oceanicola sp. S124]|uniref:Gfo/Idh/MocA family protein n=1 Tax=Oceanicola sp. S124 TaxID=1042378 RepID=UPI00025581AA|nr:Gfo/Idh/MocA family oxidoreductase [Oceanicola sp. S124]
MSHEPVRWGILGAANFAINVMGPAIHAAKGTEIRAVASSSEEKIAPFRAFAPGIRYHASYEALLADPEIDAVYIPLPNHIHVEWTIKALEAGKHVLCEKPIAMQEADFDRLIAARDASGLLASEAFMIVHHPQWQRVKALLAAGEIGELLQVNALFTYENSDMGNIRNKPETGGGGLRDIGVYTFGATRFATGQEPVAMKDARMELRNGVDTLAANVFEFDGFDLHSLVSTRMMGRQEVQFHGTRGSIVVSCPFNALHFSQAELRINRAGEERLERFPRFDQYILQVEAFGAAMRGEASWPWPLEAARGTQAMIDQALSAG